MQTLQKMNVVRMTLRGTPCVHTRNPPVCIRTQKDDDDDDVGLNILRCRLTHKGQDAKQITHVR